MATDIIADFGFDELTLKEIHCDDIYFTLGNRQLISQDSLTINAPVITIGQPGQQTQFYGDLSKMNVTNLEVNDELIEINKDGNDASSKGSGFEISATQGDSAGYVKTDSNGTEFQIKAPLNDYVLSTGVLTSNAEILNDGSNLDRTKVSAVSDDANKVIVNDSDGKLSSETELSKSRGGFGEDMSSVLTGNNNKILGWDGTNHVVELEDAPSTEIDDYSLSLNKLADTTDGNYYGSILMVNDQTDDNNKHNVKLSRTDMYFDGSNWELNKPLFCRDSEYFGILNQTGNPCESLKKFTYVNTTSSDSGNWKDSNCSFYFETNNVEKATLKYKLFGVSEDSLCIYDEGWILISYDYNVNSNKPEVSSILDRRTNKDTLMSDCDVEFDCNAVKLCKLEVKGLSNKTIQWQIHFEVFVCQFNA